MHVLALAVIALAQGGEIASGHLYPGASPATASAVSGGGFVAVPFDSGVTNHSVVAGIDASWAPTERIGLRVVAAGVGTHGYNMERNNYAQLLTMVGARFLVLDLPSVRIAPTIGVGLSFVEEEDAIVLPGAGLALELGSRVFWFDLSAPLLVPGHSSLIALVFGEAGLNARIAGRHGVRVGAVATLGVASYRYEADHWYLGGGYFAPLSVWGLRSLGPSLEGGVRF